MTQSAQRTTTHRGRFDVTFHGSDFSPAIGINRSSRVWASATELHNGVEPISGGAHVTVQQVVPSNNGNVIVRIWVDNVPVDILVQVTLFCLD
jgi:hypothetical protein